MSAFIPMTVAASSLVVGCNDDVDTPPWYPNYTDSGYGGAKAKGGAAGSAGSAGASGAAGAGGTSAAAGGTSAGTGEAGEGGAP